MFSNKPLNCKYITQCSGCQIAQLEKTEQVDFKIQHFSDLWKKNFGSTPTIDFIRPAESHFRDRIDVTVYRDAIGNSCDENNIEDQKIGFYKKDSRDILDIDECPLSSEGLTQAYSLLRKVNFPIQKGSLRLRVSPDSKKGLWIDFSNEDIKKLLDEKSTLQELTNIFDVIEIGQKRKKLSQVGEQFKLQEPEIHNWFETYDKDLNPVPLQMNVGSFSQTGFKTNKVLIEKLLEVLNSTQRHLQLVSQNLEGRTWLELCSGSGNLTVPLISNFDKVIATELDENAVESLKATARNLNLSDRLQVERINIHKPSTRIEDLLSGIDGVLADPPRSGLQGFIEVISKLPQEKLPKNFVYVSCFAETLISDLAALTKIGYNSNKIIGVDQFPHSTHCEWIVHLNR